MTNSQGHPRDWAGPGNHQQEMPREGQEQKSKRGTHRTPGLEGWAGNARGACGLKTGQAAGEGGCRKGRPYRQAGGHIKETQNLAELGVRPVLWTDCHGPGDVPVGPYQSVTK